MHSKYDKIMSTKYMELISYVLIITPPLYDNMIRYKIFIVRSKADYGQLHLPHCTLKNNGKKLNRPTADDSRCVGWLHAVISYL